jgi:MFS family permease
MILGTFATALLMACWAGVTHYWQFVTIWMCLGACMALVLTQPAYAAFMQVVSPRENDAITLTAFATGLSATVLIPIGSALIGAMGWRHALLCLAAANALCGCLSVIAFQPWVRNVGSRDTTPKGRVNPPPVKNFLKVIRVPAFWIMTVAFATNAALNTILAVYFVPLFVGRGFPMTEVVAAAAAMGPAQIGVRVLMMFGGRRMPTARFRGLVMFTLQLVATLLLPWCSAGGSVPWLLYAFALISGLSAGGLLIVRATITTEMFGPQEYASIQGLLQTVMTLARALMPIPAGFAMRAADTGWFDWLLIGLSAASVVSMAAVLRHSARQPDASPYGMEEDAGR